MGGSATQQGGGIYTESCRNVLVAHTLLANNTATTGGGTFLGGPDAGVDVRRLRRALAATTSGSAEPVTCVALLLNATLAGNSAAVQQQQQQGQQVSGGVS